MPGLSGDSQSGERLIAFHLAEDLGLRVTLFLKHDASADLKIQSKTLACLVAGASCLIIEGRRLIRDIRGPLFERDALSRVNAAENILRDRRTQDL